jgi:WD40 repeat protein
VTILRAVIGTTLGLTASLFGADTPVSFFQQIRPILVRNCQGCHQSASKQSGLDLTTYKDFLAGGRKGPALAAGNPEKSVVIAYLTGETKPQMPFGGKPLPEEEIGLLRRWIREGAKDDTPSDVLTAAPTGPVIYHAQPVITALAISPDGQMMAISGYREVLLHKSGGGLIARLPGVSDRIHSLVFSPDGKMLAAVGGSPARFGEVQFWDVASRKLLHSTVLSSDTLFGASFSPDGKTLALGGADKSVRLFDVASGKEARKIDLHEEWVFGTVFGVDGKRLVSVSRDRAAKLIDAHTGAFIENVNLLHEPLSAVARHPRKDWVVIGGDEGIPYLYMMDRPRAMRIADDSTLIRAFEKQEAPIMTLAISPDASLVAVGSAAGPVRTYNLETGKLVAQFTGHSGGIYAVAFPPDGQHLVTAGFDGTVRIYDLAGKLAQSFGPAPVEKAVVSQR